MNASAIRSTTFETLRLLGLVLRHIAAPLVSFVVSYITVIFGMIIAVPLGGQVGFVLLCGVVGFCGVMAGAGCLPPASRRIGSIALLLLGLFYFCRFVAEWGVQETDEGNLVNVDGIWWARLIFLALGGGAAVVVNSWPFFQWLAIRKESLVAGREEG